MGPGRLSQIFLNPSDPIGLMCHILSCKSKDEKLVFSVVLGATG